MLDKRLWPKRFRLMYNVQCIMRIDCTGEGNSAKAGPRSKARRLLHYSGIAA